MVCSKPNIIPHKIYEVVLRLMELLALAKTIKRVVFVVSTYLA